MVPTGPPRVLGCCAPGGKWGSGGPISSPAIEDPTPKDETRARARAPRRARALGPGALGPEGLGPWALGPLALGAWARARGVPTAPLPGARGPASPPEEQACGSRGELARRDRPASPRAGGARAVGASSSAALAAPRPRGKGPGRAPGGWGARPRGTGPGRAPARGPASPPPARARPVASSRARPWQPLARAGQARGELPREALPAPRPLGQGLWRAPARGPGSPSPARARPGARARAGQACQPPARAGQASGARARAGRGHSEPGVWGELPRAGQACQPPARAGQAWGARPRGVMAAPRPRGTGLGRVPGGWGERPRGAGVPAPRPRWTGLGRAGEARLGRAPGGWGERPRAGQACQPSARAGHACQPPARAGQAWGACLEAGARARAGQACQPPARAGQASGARARPGRGARLEAGASSRARGRPARPRAGEDRQRRAPGGPASPPRPACPPRERGSAWLVAARCPPRSRRAALFPAFFHDNGKLSTWYHSSKIHHIFVRLPTKFGVIPSRFLFFMNFWTFNGWKIKINTSGFLKILKQILQLDWIFPNLCAKFQLQIIFFLGFRGGGPAGT